VPPGSESRVPSRRSQGNVVLMAVLWLTPHYPVDPPGPRMADVRGLFRDERGRLRNGVALSILRYKCPNTSIEVMTGIDTDRDALARMRKLRISVWCPCCDTTHSIPAEEMYFSSKIAPSLATQT
jgi:hypothetical protein